MARRSARTGWGKSRRAALLHFYYSAVAAGRRRCGLRHVAAARDQVAEDNPGAEDDPGTRGGAVGGGHAVAGDDAEAVGGVPTATGGASRRAASAAAQSLTAAALFILRARWPISVLSPESVVKLPAMKVPRAATA